jgi:nitroimidazol reductase NimA-like FMN-containing flavoprotein (pyridoxamine 5'-phosphate oxidase superfamily)
MQYVAAEMFALTTKECLQLLDMVDIGRLAVVHDGYPVALPVNYKVTRLDGNPAIAIRTRPGNVLDHHDERVGFEIDGVDPGHDGGWSVLVRGTLLSVVPQERLDSRPLVSDGRHAWRVIAISTITGRRVPPDPLRWAYHPGGYL